MIQDLMESVTGARMHPSYCRVGGLQDDLPRGFLKRSAEVLAETRKRIGEFETLIMGNEIIYARTRDVGLLRPRPRSRSVRRTSAPREWRSDGSPEGRAVRSTRRWSSTFRWERRAVATTASGS